MHLSQFVTAPRTIVSSAVVRIRLPTGLLLAVVPRHVLGQVDIPIRASYAISNTMSTHNILLLQIPASILPQHRTTTPQNQSMLHKGIS